MKTRVFSSSYLGVNSELVAVATQANMSDMNRVTATTARMMNVCFTKTMNVKDRIRLILRFFFLYMEASVRN